MRQKRSAPSSWYVAFDTTDESSTTDLECKDGVYSELSLHRLHFNQSGKPMVVKVYLNDDNENIATFPDSSSSVGSENVKTNAVPYTALSPNLSNSPREEVVTSINTSHENQVSNHEDEVSPMIDEAFSSSPIKHELPTSTTMKRSKNRRGMKKKKKNVSLKTGQPSKKHSISQAMENLEKVDTLPLKTGTLYIYRGANPRVEFIRQQL